MHIAEVPRETPVRHQVDVLVVGGGASGLAASISAARAGARVLLVEKHAFLGGTMTAVTLGSICGLYGVRDGNVQRLVRGFADDVIDRLRRRRGAGAPKLWLSTASLPYHPEPLKTVADEMVRQAGVEVLFQTLAVGALTDSGRVRGVVFENIEGRWACLAGTTIDCSGDGAVAALSGAEWQCDPADLQFPTTMMRFGGVRTDVVDAMDRPTLHRHLEAAVAAGFELPRTAGGIFVFNDTVAHLNITRVTKNGRAPNPLSAREMTDAEMDGRLMAETYLAAFRAHVPGYERAWLLDTGSQIGVRESRRITGDYVVTTEDALGGGRFDDAVACCAWPVEEHGADRATRWVWLPDGTYYQIPYRCLLPRGIDGLLVAGRCCSATHEAQASLRVAGTCFALGEAAGVAAAMAVDRHDGLPRAVPIADLQDALIGNGAFLGVGAPDELPTASGVLEGSA